MFTSDCEKTKKCVSITAYGASDQYLTCILQVNPLEPNGMECPAECITKYGGCTGQRRFDFGLSYLFDQTNVMSNLLTHMRVKGAQTMVLLTSLRDVATQTHNSVVDDAKEKGIDILLDYRLRINVTTQEDGPALSDAEAMELAQQIKSLDPDVLAIASDSSQTEDMLTFKRLIKASKEINWMPRAILGGSGSYFSLATGIGELTGDKSDGRFIYGSNVNDMGLKGRVFQTKPNPADQNAVLTRALPNIQFEPFAYDEVNKEYGAQIFREAYVAAFGNGENEDDVYHGNILPQVSGTVVMMAVKLVEQAGSTDPLDLQAASYRVSAPSIGGLIQVRTTMQRTQCIHAAHTRCLARLRSGGVSRSYLIPFFCCSSF
jgi:hypothetical protein